MSVNRFDNWAKVNERIQQESEKSSGIWAQTPENALEERKKIQEKWKKAQKVVGGKIRQEETQRKNVRSIFWGLAIITVVASTMPSLLRFSKQKFAEIFPPEKEEEVGKEVEDPTLEKKDPFKDTINNVHEYNQKLQRAIDISDGKDVSPSEQK
jgi:hypothetical protein